MAPETIENLLKSVLPPENIEGLEPNKVNIEIWRTISHQTKSADLEIAGYAGSGAKILCSNCKYD